MTEKTTSEPISRRGALSLIGIAALSFAVPATVLAVSNAKAEQASSPPAQTPTTTQTGTERRQERRTRRVRRRMARRTGRKQRRQLRRTGTEKKK